MSDALDDGTEMKLDQALLEFMRRFDAGQIEDREAFLKEFSEIAPQLRSLLDAADWIEHMAGPTISELGAASESALEESTPSVDPNAVTLPPANSKSGSKSKPLPAASLFDSTLPPSNHRSEEDLDEEGAESGRSLPYRFGDYVLERVLGRGGMGVVYLAFQLQLDRHVAIKMIRSGALASSSEVERFYSEARSAASLAHPNIVTVYHCGEFDGHHYFSMDYIPGTDLAKRMFEGPMSPKDAVRYVRDVARAIDYAHLQGVVHRDLKPANVLIDEDDKVVVTDFGLAKQLDSDRGLTATGAALGTPSYMSPEQASGKNEEQGASSDVYAIGAILFALLTGKPPFAGDSVMQTIMQVINRPAPTVRQSHPNIHVDLDTIVTKCLEKSPSRRYATAGELADDLDRFYQGIPIKARPPSMLRRAKHWLVNVPLVAALTGVRNHEPTPSQRLAQNLFIVCILGLVALWFTGDQIGHYWRDNTIPRRLVIASGTPGGMYYELAGKLAGRISEHSGSDSHVTATDGSIENLRQLELNRAHLALTQESTVRSDQVAVVAPLFFEPIHLLVKSSAAIKSVADLAGKNVIMGPKDSGTRQASVRLLRHFGISQDQLKIIESDWTHAEKHPEADAVIAVIKIGQKGIADLLKDGVYRLLSIENAGGIALNEPTFRLYEFSTSVYQSDVDLQIRTLATTALLVVRKDASARLVEECLHAVYDDKNKMDGLIAKELAANWQGLPYHEAARRYFNEIKGPE